MKATSGEDARAMSLMEEPVPRSAETVERIGKPFIRRIRRVANLNALAFIGMGVVFDKHPTHT